MKRFCLFLILAVVLSLSLCSCSLFPGIDLIEEPHDSVKQYSDMPLTGDDIDIGYYDDSEGYHILNRFDFSYDTGYEAKRSTHSYDALTSESQRDMYGKILEGVYCFSDAEGSFDGEYAMRPLMFAGEDITDKDIQATLVAVLDDHPEIFWMAPDFESFYTAQDTVGVTFSAYYTADEVVSMMRELDTALRAYFSDFSRDLSEYEREESVYRYIINNCTYDDGVENSDSYGDEHPSLYNLYGVMVDHSAVCEGYSRAFDYLCSQLGVDAVCICGMSEDDDDSEAESELHMWNAVQLDGEWYWADATWDDWDEDEDLGDVFYYLNITDEVLLADHSVDKTYEQITEDEYEELESYINSFLPVSCTATEYCYYLREGVVLTSPEDDGLADGFVAAAEKNRKSLLIIVDNDDYTPDTFADALFEGSQPYYEALDQANDRLSGVYLDDDADGVYYTDYDRKLLIFEMNYE